MWSLSVGRSSVWRRWASYENTRPRAPDLVKELPRGSLTFSWASWWGACLPFPRQRLHFHTVGHWILSLLETLPLSSSQILQFFDFFLSSALVCCFPHCFLSPGRNTVGRACYTRDFWCWYLTFSYSFPWMTLISSAKGTQLWSWPVERQSPLACWEAEIPSQQRQGLAFVWACRTGPSAQSSSGGP